MEQCTKQGLMDQYTRTDLTDNRPSRTTSMDRTITLYGERYVVTSRRHRY